MAPPLLLASSSPYRRALLSRLGIPFIWASPGVDETPLVSTNGAPGEPAPALAERLAHAKARALVEDYPGHWIVGADQVAVLDGNRTLGKPGDMARAQAQLRAASGRQLQFITALCLVNGERTLSASDTVVVQFRDLQDIEIIRYLEAEQPWDCAGSFKCEGLGISLFESIHSSDPTSLEGLPLIALCQLLREAGYRIP